MIHQNYRADFSIVKTFFREMDGTRVQIPVPEHIKLTYYVDCGKGCYVIDKGCYIVERNGSMCRNCTISPDGASLTVNLNLSRAFLHPGRLMEKSVEFIPDEDCTGKEEQLTEYRETGILLWEGKSDRGVICSDAHLLTKLMYGYSAYQLAVKRGYHGTEEEWLESLGSNSMREMTQDELDAMLNEIFETKS